MKTLVLLPLFGMGIFVILYVIAALEYPGGSWVEPNHEGFSFWHNYLCDLLDTNAINGEPNTARFYARLALAILCSSLFFQWYQLPSWFEGRTTNQRIMWLAGLLSLLIAFFLSTGNHDKILRLAGVFGTIAFVTCSIELFKIKQISLFVLSISCLVVFLANYYIYETGYLIKFLPVVQKITFLLYMAWFVLLNISMYKNIKSKRT